MGNLTEKRETVYLQYIDAVPDVFLFGHQIAWNFYEVFNSLSWFLTSCLALRLPMSGPKIFSAILMSSIVIGLFLIAFSWMIALKYMIDGVPRALQSLQAFLTPSTWRSVSNCLFSSTVLTNAARIEVRQKFAGGL